VRLSKMRAAAARRNLKAVLAADRDLDRSGAVRANDGSRRRPAAQGLQTRPTRFKQQALTTVSDLRVSL
jgi:hypothetical protein